MGKTFGSGDSTTQKKASSSTDSTKLPLAGGTLTGDVSMTGSTPSITLGSASNSDDTSLLFLSDTRDYHITQDNDARTLLIGEWNGSDPTVDVGVKVSEDGALQLNKSVVIGTAAAEDLTLTFDGNAHDFKFVLDDSADEFSLVLDSLSKFGCKSDATSALSSGNATQYPGIVYAPNYITWATDAGLTVTLSQSGSTIVMTHASGYVTLPDFGTQYYGAQFVVVNATTSSNSGAVRRTGSDNKFYHASATSGETGNQTIAAMKAKTFIYITEDKWLVVG